VRRAVATALLLAAVLVPVALAAKGDPKKQLTKADQILAHQINLHASDFPAGWTGKPSSSSKESTPRCANYHPDQSDLIETGDVDSFDFSKADGSLISSTVGIYKTEGMAQAGYLRVAQPQLITCFGELFKKSAAPNKVTIVRAGSMPFPVIGLRSNAWRLSTRATVQNQTVPITIDVVAFNSGRTDVALFFLGVGKPISSSLEQSLAHKVEDRIP
jgi:hypothetical protein